jgi:hypothetical protein
VKDHKFARRRVHHFIAVTETNTSWYYLIHFLNKMSLPCKMWNYQVNKKAYGCIWRFPPGTLLVMNQRHLCKSRAICERSHILTQTGASFHCSTETLGSSNTWFISRTKCHRHVRWETTKVNKKAFWLAHGATETPDFHSQYPATRSKEISWHFVVPIAGTGSKKIMTTGSPEESRRCFS